MQQEATDKGWQSSRERDVEEEGSKEGDDFEENDAKAGGDGGRKARTNRGELRVVMRPIPLP